MVKDPELKLIVLNGSAHPAMWRVTVPTLVLPG
jgi:hypothetical protein